MYEIKGVKNLLGTFVSIKIIHEDKGSGIHAIDQAFREIQEIQNLMSLYDPNSEVFALNKIGFLEKLNKDTKFVIESAINYSELSNGIFDITILPLLRIWNGKRFNIENSGIGIKERHNIVGYKNIIFENDSIYFKKPNMGITLGAVAKGYAVDKAIKVLKENKIRHALINAGGDIRAIGGKSKDIPWRIGIRDPINKKRVITSIEIFDKAIATSGSYQRPFNDIIDPRDGLPAQKLFSSTIIAEKAMDADVLATLIFILGVDEGIEVLDKIKAVNGVFVKPNGECVKYHM